MKYFALPLVFLFLFFISSCSYDVSKDNEQTKTGTEQTQIQKKIPAQIQENRSTVTAEVEGVYGRNKEDFFLKVRIIKVEGNSANSSMAIPGASYLLIPSFQLDDKQKIITSDKNTGLFNLVKLRAGDTFKATIFFKQYDGWYIESVL